MKSILLTVFVLFTHFAIAQKDLIGLRGGMNWSRVDSNIPYENSTESRGFTGGVTYQKQFENGFYWGADLLYTERGFVDDQIAGLLIDPCFGCLRIALPVNNEYNYNYLSVPIKAGITLGNRFMFFSDLALIPGILVKSNIEAGPFSQDIKGADTFDLGAQIEIGAAFQLFEAWSIYSALGGFHSLTTVSDEGFFPNNEIRHQNINLSFGVRYTLTRS